MKATQENDVEGQHADPVLALPTTDFIWAITVITDLATSETTSRD